MRIVLFKTLALTVAIAASSQAFAVTLEGGAVAAPNQYGADVAAQVLKKAVTRWTPRWPRPLPWP